MMRPFSKPEERALVKLNGFTGETKLDVSYDRPSIYERLADHGLVSITLSHRRKRARLTKTGRYFAQLVAAREGRS